MNVHDGPNRLNSMEVEPLYKAPSSATKLELPDLAKSTFQRIPDRTRGEKIGKAFLAAGVSLVVGAAGGGIAAASFLAWVNFAIAGAVIIAISAAIKSKEGMIAGAAIAAGPIGLGIATLAAMAATFKYMYKE